MKVNYIALAIPFFFLLIGVELFVARARKQKLYRLNDAVNDLSCGMLQQVAVFFMRALTIAGYLWIYQAFRLFELPSDRVWPWLACWLAVDFCYYWFHRLSHEINFLWAAHVVHHQSEEYNLAVALRQNWVATTTFGSGDKLPLPS